MELNEFKNLWQQNSHKMESGVQVPASELNAMLFSNTQDLISKILRSLQLEYYASILAVIICFPVILISPLFAVRLVAAGCLVFCLPFIFYYYQQIKRLKSFNKVEGSLKDSILYFYTHFNKYLRLYVFVYRLMIPVGFLIGLFIGGNLSGDPKFLQTVTQPIVCIILLLVLGLCMFVMDKALKLYLNKLYGQHLQKLKQIMESFNVN